MSAQDGATATQRGAYQTPMAQSFVALAVALSWNTRKSIGAWQRERFVV
jgi:hypothetical protein